MRTDTSFRCLRLLLCLAALSGAGFAADQPVAGVVPIRLTLSDGRTVVDATLVQSRADASLAPGGQPVAVETFSISYRVGPTETRTLSLSRAEAEEIVRIARDFANPAQRYQVARSTDGFSAGTPQYLALSLDRRGALMRYSDRPASEQDLLRPEYAGGNPLFARVRYSFQDASRELRPGTTQMDPHGRIVIGADGRVAYVGYGKEASVFEVRAGESRNAVNGVFPSVDAALAAARGSPPDTSQLRFAADFGPQYSGNREAGRPRRNQLMPLIPLGTVRDPRTRETFVVALPPDLLQAYRRGEVPVDKLLLIPPTALRFVGSPADWNRIVDDYLDLRATGRGVDRIFVANRRPPRGEGATSGGTLNSNLIFGDRAEEMSRTLGELRGQVPGSILSLDFDNCDSALRRAKRKPPPA